MKQGGLEYVVLSGSEDTLMDSIYRKYLESVKPQNIGFNKKEKEVIFN